MIALRLSLALFSCVAGSGCSYALMRPAPADHERLEWVECTSGRAAPVADVVGVVEGIGMALAVQIFDSYGVLGHGDGEVSAGGRALQIASLGVAAAYAASAVYGFGSASECEHAKGLWAAREAERSQQVAPVPTPAPARRQRSPGCGADAECKAGRVCVDGACVWPPGPSTPAAAPPVTPTASPPAPAP